MPNDNWRRAGSRAKQAEARNRVLEAALREMLDVAERLAWYAARGGSVTVGQYDARILRARAALTEPTPPAGEQVMPRVKGKPFRCPCGCNVFTKRGNEYSCNACETVYEGKPEEPR